MRDHFTCQRCGARATEVHHIVELTPGNIGDKDISLGLGNLQSLCGRCHKEITAYEHGEREPDSGIDYYFDGDGKLQRLLPPGA